MLKLLGLHSHCKHFYLSLSFSNPSFLPSQMASTNTLAIKAISTMKIATIHIDNEPSIHVEHFFDIQELEKVGLKLNETLLFCGARSSMNLM